MKIGILGGTFDPPHIVHLILASEACEQLSLERLLWVLTADPPHKQGRSITPLAQRLALLQAALADNPTFEMSRIDIDRPPPHYARDTVRLLARRNPAAQLVYLMGGDSLRDLPTWHAPDEFLASVDEIGVLRRPGAVFEMEVLERELPGLKGKVRFINAPLMQVSSTMIRQRVRTGRAFRYYLLPAVYQLIIERSLYLQAEEVEAAEDGVFHEGG